MVERISSRNNPQLIGAAKLLGSAARRQESGLFAVEGLRLCRDAAIVSGYQPEALFYTDAAYEKSPELIEQLSERCSRVYAVERNAFKKLSDTVSPQGVCCLFRLPQQPLQIKQNGKYIVLCSVADPANLGAVSRTSEALGVDGIIVCGEHACDIYNPKALRASMGALLRLPVSRMSTEQMVTRLREQGIRIYGSTPRADAISVAECDFSDGCAVLIGNEANGLNEQELSCCDGLVTIPMRGAAESLNAAAAAAIVIYELTRREGAE